MVITLSKGRIGVPFFIPTERLQKNGCSTFELMLSVWKFGKTAEAVNEFSLDTLCTSWWGRKQHADISGGVTQQTAVVYGPP